MVYDEEKREGIGGSLNLSERLDGIGLIIRLLLLGAFTLLIVGDTMYELCYERPVRRLALAKRRSQRRTRKKISFNTSTPLLFP